MKRSWSMRLTRRRGDILVVVGVVLTVIGALLAQHNESTRYGDVPEATDVTTEPAASVVSWAAAFGAKPTPPRRTGSSRPATAAASSPDRMPLRLQANVMGADAAIVPVGVRSDRSLILPAADQVGWWIGGAQPGDTRGTVVLAGHVDDHDGDHGALFGLSALRPGDQIRIATAAGRTNYEVVAMRTFPRQQLPAELFDQTVPIRLVLLTCGGPFQPGRGYANNVAAYAQPASRR